MPSVHDGFSRVLPHASRSHQVKGRLNDAAVQNINGARGFQRLPPHARPMVQNLQTILTVTVNDARSGNAIRVFHFRIQFNSVTLFRQVFTQYSHPHDMPKSLAHHAMMLRSPGHGLVHKSTPSLVQRAEGSFQEKRIAAHEPPFQVSLIKLFAERRNTKGPFPPVHLFLKYSFQKPERMDHEIPAHQSRRICETIGKESGFGIEEQSRRSNAVRTEHHHAGRLLEKAALGVVIKGAVNPAPRIQSDLADACAGFKDRTFAKCLRPVTDIGRGLGANWTTKHAFPMKVTRRTTLIITGNNGVIETHQYQPSLSNPRPIVSPSTPIGSGGVGRGERGGLAGSPASPATPISRSFMS